MLHIWMSSLFLMQLLLKELWQRTGNILKTYAKVAQTLGKFSQVSFMTLESLEVKKTASLDEFTVSYAAFA